MDITSQPHFLGLISLLTVFSWVWRLRRSAATTNGFIEAKDKEIISKDDKMSKCAFRIWPLALPHKAFLRVCCLFVCLFVCFFFYFQLKGSKMQRRSFFDQEKMWWWKIIVLPWKLGAFKTSI